MEDWHGWMVIVGRHGGLVWMNGVCRKAGRIGQDESFYGEACRISAD